MVVSRLSRSVWMCFYRLARDWGLSLVVGLLRKTSGGLWMRFMVMLSCCC